MGQVRTIQQFRGRFSSYYVCSVADVTTLCLSFRNCTVAKFFREYPFLRVWCRCINWGIRFHINFRTPKGGFFQWFFVSGAASLLGSLATVMQYIVYFHDMLCLTSRSSFYSLYLLKYPYKLFLISKSCQCCQNSELTCSQVMQLNLVIRG